VSGYATIGGVLPGTTAGTQYIGPYILVANAAEEFAVTTITLNAGDNFIAVPPWASFTLIVPPPANTIALLLKAISTDQGLPIDPSGVTELNWPVSPPSGFVLNAASLTASPTSVIFS
jgi:hypothetical protein